jgi:hypothetical protein
MVNQRCLAGLAGSKKEMGLLIKERGQIQNPLDISGIFALNSYCRFHRHISCQMTINLSIKNGAAPAFHPQKCASSRKIKPNSKQSLQDFRYLSRLNPNIATQSLFS